MGPEPISAEAFRRACSQFATGVAIASVIDHTGTPHGITVNSFTSVSLAPPLVLICIDYRAAILTPMMEARHYGLSILRADQMDLSSRFATRPDDRFEGVSWRAGTSGVPLIDGALAQIECAVRQTLDGGDHTIFLSEVIAAEVQEGTPLLYFNSAYRNIGSS